MNDNINPRLSGKQVIADFVVLAKDTGTFISDLARTAYIKIKSIAAKKDDKKAERADA